MQYIARANLLSDNKESKNDHKMREVIANVSYNLKLQSSYKYDKQ